MWGDPERAYNLNVSDPLVILLYQIVSPAHIPYNDMRWEEILHGYHVWVHLEMMTNIDTDDAIEYNNTNNDHDTIIKQAMQSMNKNASQSSNLAALTIHVTRMIDELIELQEKNNHPQTQQQQQPSYNNYHNHHHRQHHHSIDQATAFSQRIAMVGKARALAGALQLLRIFVHAIIVSKENSRRSSSITDEIKEIFTYRSREEYEYFYKSNDEGGHYDNRRRNANKNVGLDLLFSLIQFISSSPLASSNNNPELYDVTVLIFELLLILLSTQLYQPMNSTLQKINHHKHNNNNTNVDDDDNTKNNYFLDNLFRHAYKQLQNHTTNYRWTPKDLLKSCMEWQIERPKAPKRSIIYHYAVLGRSIVTAKGEKVGSDGLFENNSIVTASNNDGNGFSKSLMDDLEFCNNEDENDDTSSNTTERKVVGSNQYGSNYYVKNPSSAIIDATKGVLVLSSTIMLLPWRLMNLALSLLGAADKNGKFKNGMGGFNSSFLASNNTSNSSSGTKSVLWLSESPVADLSNCLLLLLINNNRYNKQNDDNSNSDKQGRRQQDDDDYSCENAFRDVLENMKDGRWEREIIDGMTTLPNLPPSEFEVFPDQIKQQNEAQANAFFRNSDSIAVESSSLSINFEALFTSYGNILHTEIGALSLYTLLQSSKKFSESIVVRSDLDTLVLPLLRTLYFASNINHYDYSSDNKNISSKSTTKVEKGGNSRSSDNDNMTSRHCPFRSQSQLYVIVIILMMLSQDISFGNDAFRRVFISKPILWYKERVIKDINLGSLLILVLLRQICFNCNRLKDFFLLYNCNAILMNLSPTVSQLHEYAAMRLASVAMAYCKKCRSLAIKEQNQKHYQEAARIEKKKQYNEDEIMKNNSPLDMYYEVSDTLIRLLKHCLNHRNIEKNLHLVYALLYDQNDWKSMYNENLKYKESYNKWLFPQKEMNHIYNVIRIASQCIETIDYDNNTNSDLGNQYKANVEHNSNGISSHNSITPPRTLTASGILLILSDNMQYIKNCIMNNFENDSSGTFVNTTDPYNNNIDSVELNIIHNEDFTFTYEEEEDPEIFFVPYIWEIIVCVITSSNIEWNKKCIKVFPMMNQQEKEENGTMKVEDTNNSNNHSNNTSTMEKFVKQNEPNRINHQQQQPTRCIADLV